MFAGEVGGYVSDTIAFSGVNSMGVSSGSFAVSAITASVTGVNGGHKQVTITCAAPPKMRFSADTVRIRAQLPPSIPPADCSDLCIHGITTVSDSTVDALLSHISLQGSELTIHPTSAPLITTGADGGFSAFSITYLTP